MALATGPVEYTLPRQNRRLTLPPTNPLQQHVPQHEPGEDQRSAGDGPPMWRLEPKGEDPERHQYRFEQPKPNRLLAADRAKPTDQEDVGDGHLQAPERGQDDELQRRGPDAQRGGPGQHHQDDSEMADRDHYSVLITRTSMLLKYPSPL